MKIAMIVPGSGGGFYCENCLRDTGVVKVLRKRGHDAVMVPLYLPLYTDDPDAAGGAPVFFGGVRIYLQQKVRLLRRLPPWMGRLLDSRPLLRLAARQAASTRARGHGDMTLSMIRGEEGHQAAELDRLAEWLHREGRPDVVHLSSVLLIGLARKLKARLHAPICCVLQDEDTWIDALEPPYDRACWDAIRERADAVDCFLPVSRFYAGEMRRRLGIPPDRLHVVYPGIPAEQYRTATPNPDAPAIGYLSRMCRSLGLETLVDAFADLKSRFPTLRLRAMGGQTKDDAPFLAGLRRRLERRGYAGDVEFLPELDRASRIEFLSGLTVLSVPMPDGEAFGSFLLEAMASGVPVVQPDRGGFSEVVHATGGGRLYDPAAPGALAATLGALLADRAAAAEMGRNGRAAVRRGFTLERMADDLLRIYGQARASAEANPPDTGSGTESCPPGTELHGT